MVYAARMNLASIVSLLRYLLLFIVLCRFVVVAVSPEFTRLRFEEHRPAASFDGVHANRWSAILLDFCYCNTVPVAMGEIHLLATTEFYTVYTVGKNSQWDGKAKSHDNPLGFTRRVERLRDFWFCRVFQF